MHTTVEIKNDAYKAIVDKQNELFNKLGKKRNIKDIAEQAILKGLPLVTD